MADPFADVPLAADPFADIPVGRSVGAAIVEEGPQQILGGVRDAVQSFLNLTHRGAEFMESIAPLGSVTIGPEGIGHIPGASPTELPQVDQPTTLAGGLTRGISQFLTGFIPLLGVSRATGAGGAVAQAVGGGTLARGAGILVEAELAALAADQVVFDPQDPRLSNLIQQFPNLQNPITEYLAADPNDGEATSRFKIALEGLGLGLVTAPLVAA